MNFNQETLSTYKITPEEYSSIQKMLGRDITQVELGIFSAMWSEHCSYKSTRKWLSTLYTQSKCVICGPGENAGVIDIGDGDCLVFKMESHNHPSFIEPFNGAATGVGGIMRDIFTMGARPIANLNVLRFGSQDAPKTPYLIEGVTNGISHYGNCVGVPMLGGSTRFHRSYNKNNLVNAMSIGVAKTDKVFYSAASEIGSKVIYFGAKTGRDGIHGASMSSDSFEGSKKQSQSVVQVGDPFEEKKLIEACLEMMEAGVVGGIQDMGAAGLTCSSVEMASKGGTGIRLDTDKVPQREAGMSAHDIMLSESQERMLMTVKDGRLADAMKILSKWDLDCAEIGVVTDTGCIEIWHNGTEEARLPIEFLSCEADDIPYTIMHDEREMSELMQVDVPRGTFKDTLEDVEHSLLQIISGSNESSKKTIYEKYDRGVQGNVALSCESEAGLFGLKSLGGNKMFHVEHCVEEKMISVASHCNESYNKSNPYLGVVYSVGATYAKISALGGKPLAITNCLNFGSPKSVMGEIVDSISGMKDACKFLDYPVVSGNVSLNNQTDGEDIYPTPVVAGVGLTLSGERVCNSIFKDGEDFVYIVGDGDENLTNTEYAKTVLGIEGGNVPRGTLNEIKQNSDFVRNCVQDGLLQSASYISEGGIGVKIVKTCIKSEIGFYMHDDIHYDTLKGFLFNESQGRFLVSVSKGNNIAFTNKALEDNITLKCIGHTSDKRVINIHSHEIEIQKLADAYYSFSN